MGTELPGQMERANLPGWIRILPLGKVELVDSREPFMVDEDSLTALVAAFRSRGVDLVIDYEHQSLQGERAPAAGWIKDLEARGDGLWARVEWTPQAQEYLRNREYRYFSPVLRLDPESRKPTLLMQVGLTNVPAIKRLPPLVAKWQGEVSGGARLVQAQALKRGNGQEKGEIMEKLKRLLGLDPEGAEEALWDKVLEVFRDLAAVLQVPGDASVSQLKGALAALKAGSDQLPKIQEELKELKSRLAKETAAQVVEEALKAGKISPAQQEWAIEYFRRDPEGFKTFTAKAPRLIPAGEELRLLREGPQGEREMLPEELALCRSLNLAPEEYLKAKAQTA